MASSLTKEQYEQFLEYADRAEPCTEEEAKWYMFNDYAIPTDAVLSFWARRRLKKYGYEYVPKEQRKKSNT